jgi:hypothetical protein
MTEELELQNLSINQWKMKLSIAYPSLEILIQQIHGTKQCSIQYSLTLEHHERVYSLTHLITPQWINSSRTLMTCQPRAVPKVK